MNMYNTLGDKKAGKYVFLRRVRLFLWTFDMEIVIDYNHCKGCVICFVEMAGLFANEIILLTDALLNDMKKYRV